MSLILKRLAVSAANATGTLLLSPPIGGFGYFRNHGPRNQRKIAITFDDGPSKPCTETLLDAMAELNVKSTLFCVGVNIGWHRDLVMRAYSEGHVIANHSYEHSRKAGLRLGNNCDHIDRSAQTIAEIIGRRPRLYRPPWGWMTPWEGQRLTQRGYTIVGWDIRTSDWQWPEPDGRLVAEDTRSKTRPGSIILFHDANAGVKIWDKKQTVRAIQHLVPALRADGYEFVTVPELLGVPGYSTMQST
jgi:peptidoglycan/xylan/chitin deacetylase (PgdA/CDA1 family)